MLRSGVLWSWTLHFNFHSWTRSNGYCSSLFHCSIYAACESPGLLRLSSSPIRALDHKIGTTSRLLGPLDSWNGFDIKLGMIWLDLGPYKPLFIWPTSVVFTICKAIHILNSYIDLVLSHQMQELAALDL